MQQKLIVASLAAALQWCASVFPCRQRKNSTGRRDKNGNGDPAADHYPLLPTTHIPLGQLGLNGIGVFAALHFRQVDITPG